MYVCTYVMYVCARSFEKACEEYIKALDFIQSSDESSTANQPSVIEFIVNRVSTETFHAHVRMYMYNVIALYIFVKLRRINF